MKNIPSTTISKSSVTWGWSLSITETLEIRCISILPYNLLNVLVLDWFRPPVLCRMILSDLAVRYKQRRSLKSVSIAINWITFAFSWAHCIWCILPVEYTADGTSPNNHWSTSLCDKAKGNIKPWSVSDWMRGNLNCSTTARWPFWVHLKPTQISNENVTFEMLYFCCKCI